MEFLLANHLLDCPMYDQAMALNARTSTKSPESALSRIRTWVRLSRRPRSATVPTHALRALRDFHPQRHLTLSALSSRGSATLSPTRGQRSAGLQRTGVRRTSGGKGRHRRRLYKQEPTGALTAARHVLRVGVSSRSGGALSMH